MGPPITGQVICSIAAETASVLSVGAAGSDFFLQPLNSIKANNRKTISGIIALYVFIFPFIFFPFQIGFRNLGYATNRFSVLMMMLTMGGVCFLSFRIHHAWLCLYLQSRIDFEIALCNDDFAFVQS